MVLDLNAELEYKTNTHTQKKAKLTKKNSENILMNYIEMLW